LMEDLHLNSRLDTRFYKNIGNLKVLTYSPRLSKNAMDEIDFLIGKAFNLSDEEIKFITDYDVEFSIYNDQEVEE